MQWFFFRLLQVNKPNIKESAREKKGPIYSHTCFIYFLEISKHMCFSMAFILALVILRDYYPI
jgi:hypothetical protein